MDYAISGGWTWRYPVYRYQLLDPAPSWMADPKMFQFARLPGGVFVADGVETPTAVKPTRDYDPIEEVDGLLSAATRLDVTDNAALLEFVNRWGVLGFVVDPNSAPLWDSVFYTRDYLQRLQHVASVLDLLHARRLNGIPIGEVRAALRGVPQQPSRREHERACWQYFASLLNSMLAQTRPLPQLVADDGVPGLRQTFQPQHLRDVLPITIWQNYDGAHVPRRCKCGGLFFVSATNDRKIYCSWSCKNRFNVKAYRAKARKRQRKERAK